MNGKTLQLYGSVICVVGMVLAITQTQLFGGNAIPRSTPEAICDLICSIWILAGIVLTAVGQSIRK